MKQPLISDEQGLVTFLVDLTSPEQHDYRVEFEVYEVISWGTNNEPIEDQLYLKGVVKWDGCSHLNFGDNGYLHLCGKGCWQDHENVMKAIWKLCSSIFVINNEMFENS